jgi:ABC-type Fe3+-siderophore transport system permease subunit
LSWFVGSFYRATWSDLAIVAVGLAVTLPLLLAAIPRANLLQLGDSIAQGLGESVRNARAIVLITSCLLAGFAVCTVGGIGFVGLMAPHMVRWLVGTDMRRLVPTAALLGAALVVAMDFLARTFSTGVLTEWFGLPVNPQALPVGLFLNLIGGLFFLFLLRRLRG